MALYARTLLTRDTHTAAFSLTIPSFSLLPPYVRHITHPPLHLARFYRCILSSSSFSPPMRTHCVLVSSFSNFPRWRHRPLCSFLDTVERLNATTSPLCGFPLPLFFVFLPRGLIRPNGAIRRRGGKKDWSSAFVESFVESPDTCIY